MNKLIYLDYSATTPVDPRVAKKMTDCLTLDGNFGSTTICELVIHQICVVVHAIVLVQTDLADHGNNQNYLLPQQEGARQHFSTQNTC